ncbi:MAG: hypothetical protein ACM31J_05740 [Nitrososphaerales archaeon]
MLTVKNIFTAYCLIPLELIHIAISLVKDRGIGFKYILPVDALIPKQSEEFLEKKDIKI